MSLRLLIHGIIKDGIKPIYPNFLGTELIFQQIFHNPGHPWKCLGAGTRRNSQQGEQRAARGELGMRKNWETRPQNQLWVEPLYYVTIWEYQEFEEFPEENRRTDQPGQEGKGGQG